MGMMQSPLLMFDWVLWMVKVQVAYPALDQYHGPVHDPGFLLLLLLLTFWEALGWNSRLSEMI